MRDDVVWRDVLSEQKRETWIRGWVPIGTSRIESLFLFVIVCRIGTAARSNPVYYHLWLICLSSTYKLLHTCRYAGPYQEMSESGSDKRARRTSRDYSWQSMIGSSVPPDPSKIPGSGPTFQKQYTICQFQYQRHFLQASQLRLYEALETYNIIA